MLMIALGAVSSLPALAPPDFTPPTPLFAAVLSNNTAQVKKLLAEGANPNEKQFLGFAPISFPVLYQNLDAFRAMVEKGADIQVKDSIDSTLLMWAAYNDTGKTELVEELLKLGIDPNAKNKNGETALTWALRRGYTPVITALKKGGASDTPMIKESVEKAVALLQKSGPQFVKVSGCASCHHQSLPQMSVGMARERGFSVYEEISQQQVRAVLGMFRRCGKGCSTEPVGSPIRPSA
jgi:ankyrin repeat protein